MIKTATQRETAAVSLWVKLQTGLLAGSVKQLDHSLELVQTDLEALQMDKVNEAVAALTEAADRLAAIDVEGLNETAQSLKAAADSLTKVDVETLNGAIASLKDAANTLKDLDIEGLNGVIQSLSKTAANLQKVSDAIGSIFG